MCEKLKILLKQISFDDKSDFFLNGKIEKIICDRQKETYCFIICLEKVLPVSLYEKFLNKIKEIYPKTEVKFIISNFNEEELISYCKHLIIKYSDGSPLLKNLINNKFSYNDKIITIEVLNDAEKLRMENIEQILLKKLINLGFGDLSFNYKINKDEAKKLQNEIELSITKDLKEVLNNKEQSNIIFGNLIKTKPFTIDSAGASESKVVIEGKIFDLDFFESTRTDYKIITIKVTDYTNSIYCKIFTREIEVLNDLKNKLKINSWYRIGGYTKHDDYAKEIVLNVRDINKIDKDETIVDEEPKKRVELHVHSFMSQMDGLVDPSKLIDYAHSLGHKAVAITDHNSVQSFPIIYQQLKKINKKTPFKVLFGAELVMVNDEIDIAINPNDSDLKTSSYVVFDLETTGLKAGSGDQIIEIGAVKIKEGEIIDTFSELIDPKIPLPEIITKITKITNEDLKGKPTEEEVVKKFKDWFSDLPLVAHNAKFDLSFLINAYAKYNLGELNNPIIDTLEFSRALEPEQFRHSLSALVKRYQVEFDEDSHHRADYDAEKTSLVFEKMLNRLPKNIKTIGDLNNLISKDEIHKFGRTYHINILSKNEVGIKNLFKIISLANTKYLYKTPRILRSEIQRLREGLFISSGCYEGEVFVEAQYKTDEELSEIMNFYDFIEIQPLECYDHLIQSGVFANEADLLAYVQKIIRVADFSEKLVCATGDVHHLKKEDKIYREIIVNQKVPGGGLHPLARRNIVRIPSYHFRTTKEMLESFSFLTKEKAYKIVVENTNKIADRIENYETLVDTKGIPFSPKIKNSKEQVEKMVYERAYELYGNPLPKLLKNRIKEELSGITKGGFDVIYLISHKLVKKSNDDGYIVGSRGSVGSSFVATLMGITEVNPLPPHYLCPKCKKSIFEENGVILGSIYSSGFDLPEKECPACQTEMNRNGHDMPFATFLGFDANKVPDIDLNFSGEYQWIAHEYTKELFGVDNVYRAGTIGTVASKTAYGFVMGYCEDKGVNLRGAEIERLALGCTGVKRTTGQHPGGIVVVPDYKEIYDFTPYQYPADDSKSLWRTTHFDYHAIEESLLKLDILGHDDPTILKMLQDLSKVDISKINMADSKVMKIFSGPEILGVSKEQILCETGTLGVPEFGTNFVISMLNDTKPKTFGELLKISGLSHGTDVWLGNAQELIKQNICEFKNVIGCRDDIMVYLSYNGVKPKDAFKIMEFVRKGRPSREPEEWAKYENIMKEANIPDWYIESCHKIKYMFPKAHAAAYVMSALKIAWFKVHMPIYFYLSYFSIRCSDFDIEVMIKGYDAIKERIGEIIDKGYEATNKELAILEVLNVALEATARGFVFANIDLEKSDSVNFILLDDKTLLPPFRSIDGLGIQVANNIIKERKKKPFISIEELQRRGKVNTTVIDKMRLMKVLKDLPETNQLSLF